MISYHHQEGKGNAWDGRIRLVSKMDATRQNKQRLWKQKVGGVSSFGLKLGISAAAQRRRDWGLKLI